MANIAIDVTSVSQNKDRLMWHVHACGIVGRRHRSVVAIILAAYSWFSCVCHAQTNAPDEWRKRFFDEAPRKWQDYIAFSERLQGTGTIIVRDDKGATLYQSFGERKRNADCGLVSGGVVGNWELTAFNAAYTFRLHRKSSDQPWVITGLSKRQPGVVNQDIRDTMGALGHREMLHLSQSCELPDLVRQKSFRVLQAASVNRDGAELVRIDFENLHPPTETPFFAVQSGLLLLDPARFWCLRGGEISCKHPHGETQTTVDILCRDAEGKYPIPVRRVDTIVTRWPDKPAEKGTYTHDIQLQVPDPPPGDEEFTLSAFGLPESAIHGPDASAKPTAWWLWVALVGGGFLVLGAVFAWLRDRARAQRR